MGGGTNAMVGINLYTLIFIKWIINKDFLWSTRNSTQQSVTTNRGTESEREQIYVSA